MTDSSLSVKGIDRELPGWWRRDWIMGLLLLGLACLPYLPAMSGQFVWDDDAWTSNIYWLLRDCQGLRWMWSMPTALQQYYPLTGTTFWLDYQLWGFWTLPYHAENVFGHGVAAILFWRLLRRLEVRGNWLAGAMFAVHPVMVESVAWITERKNVLSLVLFLSAMLAYGRFNGYWKAGSESPRWKDYSVALILFVAALLAKVTAFALPPVILLLYWWKRGRIRWREVLPVLPFFLFAILFGLGIAWIETNNVGAKGAEFEFSLLERCLIAGRALWFYAGKLLWPVNLCFVYPRWQLDVRSVEQWMCPATAAAGIVLLWSARSRIGRAPVTAAFYFAGTLFPVLGFMNAYFMRYAFVWDHLVYLSSLGLIALLASLVVRARPLFPGAAVNYGMEVMLLVILASLTWRQCGTYRDIETLYRTTIERNPDAWMAENNLGDVLLQKGKTDEAIRHFQRAVASNPRFAEAYNNLGNGYLRVGQVNEAIASFQRAVELKPEFEEAHCNLGNTYLHTGETAKAIRCFQTALERNPKNAEAHNSLGSVFLQSGATNDAIMHFQNALAIKPQFVEACINLGSAFRRNGQMPQAIASFERALEIDPRSAIAHNNLGNAFVQSGRAEEAIVHYRKALDTEPASLQTIGNLAWALYQSGKPEDAIIQYRKSLEINSESVEALEGSAWILSTCPSDSVRDGTKALELAEKADRLTGHGNLLVQRTLAAAYAEAGRFDDALRFAQNAIDGAKSQGQNGLAQEIEVQRECYRQERPFRTAR